MQVKQTTSLYVRIPVELRDRIDQAVLERYRFRAKGAIAVLVTEALEAAFPAAKVKPAKPAKKAVRK